MVIAEIIDAAGFDEYDADMGTAGLCGTFALALKEVFPEVDLALVCLKGADGNVVVCEEDGIPVWRHVVGLHGDILLDVDGAVQLEHVIENYCWDNKRGSGGSLYPVSAEKLREIVFSDDKSFDERWFNKWVDDLSRSREQTMAREERSPGI